MELIICKRDCYIATAIVGAFLCLVAYHTYDKARIEQELHDYARAQAILNIGGEGDLDKYDFISIVHSEKTFHIAGPAWGAIHSFVREKGDEEMKTFKGYEYFLKREEDGWREVDSAGCGALEHHVDGFQEFERRGLKVAQGAYDKALGFKKNASHDHDHSHDHSHDHDHDHNHDHNHDHDHDHSKDKVSKADTAKQEEQVL